MEDMNVEGTYLLLARPDTSISRDGRKIWKREREREDGRY